MCLVQLCLCYQVSPALLRTAAVRCAGVSEIRGEREEEGEESLAVMRWPMEKAVGSAAGVVVFLCGGGVKRSLETAEDEVRSSAFVRFWSDSLPVVRRCSKSARRVVVFTPVPVVLGIRCGFGAAVTR